MTWRGVTRPAGSRHGVARQVREPTRAARKPRRETAGAFFHMRQMVLRQIEPGLELCRIARRARSSYSDVRQRSVALPIPARMRMQGGQYDGC